jgi:hypothetical protein
MKTPGARCARGLGLAQGLVGDVVKIFFASVEGVDNLVNIQAIRMRPGNKEFGWQPLSFSDREAGASKKFYDFTSVAAEAGEVEKMGKGIFPAHDLFGLPTVDFALHAKTS